MNELDSYVHDLATLLAEHGLDDEHIRQVTDEVRAHLTESGRSPVDEFGSARSYAEALTTADPDPSTAGAHFEVRTFRATATDEMGILAELGRDGWELTGVRDFGLHARRPVAPADRRTWRYQRRNAIRSEKVVHEMGADGWEPCGRWVTFHYFKQADPAAPEALRG